MGVVSNWQLSAVPNTHSVCCWLATSQVLNQVRCSAWTNQITDPEMVLWNSWPGPNFHMSPSRAGGGSHIQHSLDQRQFWNRATTVKGRLDNHSRSRTSIPLRHDHSILQWHNMWEQWVMNDKYSSTLRNDSTDVCLYTIGCFISS